MTAQQQQNYQSTYVALPIAEIERASRKGWGKYFAIANIASNLREVANDHVSENTVLRVVGNDLPNVAEPAYVWSNTCLPEWLDRGATVKYFTLNPQQQAIQSFERLVQDNPSRKLEVRKLNCTSELSQRAMKCTSLWSTFHFAAFDKVPQLWVEMHHPPSSIRARDCYYFEPGQAEQLFLYEDLTSDFDYMFEEYGEPALQ